MPHKDIKKELDKYGFSFTGIYTRGGGHERWTNGVFVLHVPSSSKMLSTSKKNQIANIRRAAALTAVGKTPKDDPRFTAGQRRLAADNGMAAEEILEAMPVEEHEHPDWMNAHWYKAHQKWNELAAKEAKQQPEPEVKSMAKIKPKDITPDVPTTEQLIADAFGVSPNGVNVAVRNGSTFRKKFAVLRFDASKAHKATYRNTKFMVHLVPMNELGSWIPLLEEKHGTPCLNKDKFKTWPVQAPPEAAPKKVVDQGTAKVIAGLEMDLASLRTKHAGLKEDYRKLQQAHDKKIADHKSAARKLREAEDDLTTERRVNKRLQKNVDDALSSVEDARNAYEELKVKADALETAPAAFGQAPQLLAPQANDPMYQLAAKMLLDVVPEGTKQSENLKAVARIMLAPFLDDEA